MPRRGLLLLLLMARTPGAGRHVRELHATKLRRRLLLLLLRLPHAVAVQVEFKNKL